LRLKSNWFVEDETHDFSNKCTFYSNTKVEFGWEHALHRFIPEFLSLSMLARKEEQVKRSVTVVLDKNLASDKTEAKFVQLFLVQFKDTPKKIARIVTR
jgi:hypothetical protein